MEHSNFKIQLNQSFQSFPRSIQMHHLLGKIIIPLFVCQWSSILAMFGIYYMPSCHSEYTSQVAFMKKGNSHTVLLFSFKMIDPSIAECMVSDMYLLSLCCIKNFKKIDNINYHLIQKIENIIKHIKYRKCLIPCTSRKYL